jgi:hypothetical protein
MPTRLSKPRCWYFDFLVRRRILDDRGDPTLIRLIRRSVPQRPVKYEELALVNRNCDQFGVGDKLSTNSHRFTIRGHVEVLWHFPNQMRSIDNLKARFWRCASQPDVDGNTPPASVLDINVPSMDLSRFSKRCT